MENLNGTKNKNSMQINSVIITEPEIHKAVQWDLIKLLRIGRQRKNSQLFEINSKLQKFKTLKHLQQYNILTYLNNNRIRYEYY